MRSRLIAVAAVACLAAAVLYAAGARAPKGKDAAQAVDHAGGHRDAVARIARGNAGAAIAAMTAVLEAHPNDAETLYVLACAHAAKKDVDKAMDCASKAVAAGLPVERFIAGPRDLLGPLLESAAFREFARGRAGLLVHGPLLGSMTDTSVRFWVRTAAEAAVKVVVAAPAPADLALPVRSAEVRTSAAADYTAVAAVGGLRPDTAYCYEVLVDGQRAAALAPFRTFPKAGAPAKFQVAFGGGANFVPANERMWDVILRREPAALLMLGDNVYIDWPEVAAAQRYCYYRRQSRPEHRRLAASVPVFSIYDDHDFGDNDCIPGPDIEKPAWKRAAWGVFCENWVNPSYGGGREQPGCWYNFSIGDVDFFMLDCRFYRNPAGKPPSMLGPVQKRLFLDALGRSKGRFRVLASSVPWASGTKPGSRDTWDGFPEEREEIFRFAESGGIGGLVLISADRHRSDVWKVPRPGYDLYEFESSKLTNLHTHGKVPGAMFSYNEKCSAGWLEFDTAAADPSVTYRIISIDDELIHTFAVKRSQLGPAK
ncbi:MAG: alkaline phosphatase family protein [Planctomycetes bacterium]|nr:alkaline phosphatase family protein [Planctomycetota bacterium]